MRKPITQQKLFLLKEDELALLIDQVLEEIKKTDRIKNSSGQRLEPLAAIAQSIEVDHKQLSKSRKPKNQVSPKETFRKDTLWKLSEVYQIQFFDDHSFSFLDTQSDSPIERLAGKLALNLVDVSSKIGDNLPYSNILADEKLWGERSKAKVVQRERFVVITGAGASNAATPKSNPMPSSRKAVEQIKAAYPGEVLQKLISDKIYDLSESFEEAENPSFELQMRALISFSPEIAIHELRRICGLKHASSLVYEILAHLLKHRFIDAIINFNYDELLDNAIQEELPNPGDFQYIYTAGHCQQKLEDLYIDNRIKHPIYIKCHGTISHPNSMRFTESDAFTIEQAIQRHIEDLFMGKVPKAQSNKQQELPLNLLIFGFAMENSVFNQILQKVNSLKDENITFWIFDNDPDFIEKKINQTISSKFGEKNKISIEKIPLKQHGGMKEELKKLWQATSSCFKKPYKPKGIARHELVSLVFSGTSPLDFIDKSSQKEDKKALSEYYHDRLLVEIAILLLESDGIIHLGQITGARAGKMYEQYKKSLSYTSIHSILRSMGLKIYQDYMDDTYVTKNIEHRSSTEMLVNFVYKKLKDKLNYPRKEALSAAEVENNFKALATEVRKRRLGMVNPQYVNIHDNLFSSVREEDVMNTSLAWIYNYRRLIDQEPDKWDLMLAITEKGSFLREEEAERIFKGKFFEIILATSDITEETMGVSGAPLQLNYLSGEPQFRPWWSHNKHMVIFLKRNNRAYTGDYLKDWGMVEGFYYTHRLLSKRYTPVRIHEEKDLQRMLNIYAIYWDGATSYRRDEAEGSTSMKLTNSRAARDAALKRLFDLYEKRKREVDGE